MVLHAVHNFCLQLVYSLWALKSQLPESQRKRKWLFSIFKLPSKGNAINLPINFLIKVAL